jgi:hypothetical protein
LNHLRTVGMSLLLALAVSVGCKSSDPKPSTKVELLRSSTPTLPEDPAAGQLALARWTEHLQEEERGRQANYDRRRLPEHLALIELFEQTRDNYERASTNVAVKRAQGRFRALAPQLRGRIQGIDRFGRSSPVLHDYAALSELFSDSYASARLAALGGDRVALEQARSAAAARLAKIREWLEFAATAEDE